MKLRVAFGSGSRRFRPAFTTMELLITMAIFVIAAASILPFLGGFQQKQTLDTEAQNIVQTLRRAQSRSIAAQHDTQWGVHFQAGRYELFAGSTYEERNPALSEEHSLANAFLLTGLEEVSFLLLTGDTREEGEITLSRADGEERSIVINAAGAIFLLSQ